MQKPEMYVLICALTIMANFAGLFALYQKMDKEAEANRTFRYFMRADILKERKGAQNDIPN